MYTEKAIMTFFFCSWQLSYLKHGKWVTNKKKEVLNVLGGFFSFNIESVKQYSYQHWNEPVSAWEEQQYKE